MANQVTIDVEARFIDNVSGEAKAASKAFDDVEKNARQAAKEVDNLGKKKADPKVDADTKPVTGKVSKVEKILAKLGRSKTDAKLGALDRASAVINKVINKTKALTGKTHNLLLKTRDSAALASLNKMSDGLKKITGKAWSVAVKVKDLATAPLRGIKNMLFSIKGLVLAITAGFAAKQFVLNPINLADAYSSAKIGFSTLMGESAGQKMMNDLDDFARVTPFNTSNVISSAQKMMAMGWDTDTLLDDLETIGNAAAATGKLDQGLESIVRAMSQIKTKGRLSTEELNQLAEAGIAAKAMLAEQLGYGTGDAGIAAMTEDLENGAIASNVAIQALMAGMKKYDGMMDSMANETVEGLAAQIKDTFEINVFRKWGQGLQDGAKRGFGTVLQLLDEAEDALGEFGDLMYEIGEKASNWVADKFQNSVDRILEITGSYEFQNASLGDKISMLWNGVIADPLQEWWEGGGQQKTAETAGKIGKWIGEMLTKGLLALLGVTDIFAESGLDENGGMSVAQSFAKGFVDAFDVSAITDKLAQAIGNVWGALPWWAKLLVGGYGVGKAAGGIANLAGGILNFAGGVKNAVGGFKASIVPIGPSYVAGSGILGTVGKAGVALGATTTGGALLAGTAGIAGGVAGAVSAGSGIYDLYKSHKYRESGDTVESNARLVSGVSKVGGVAAGAATGAAIGSIIPGLGTALGALIGAGIGGVGGWLFGDNAAKNIRKTDDAINDVSAAMEELETEEEKIYQKNKMVWENMKSHMGDIKLSASEIVRLVDQIVWGDYLTKFEQFSTATQQAEASLKSMKTSAESVNRWMWKAGLGVKFNEDEIEGIKESFDDYINSAKAYVENKHYEFTAAVSLLVDIESEGGKSLLESGNAFYGKLQEQLNTLGGKLSETVDIALQDGVISLDEQAEITNLQQQIAAITEKISDAKVKAELELINLKFGGGNLSLESFDTFMTQMETTLSQRLAANDEAFKVSVTSLEMQLADGAITQDQYDAQLKTILEGYTAQVESIRAEIMGVELEIIGDAYDIDTEVLSNALKTSLTQGISPISWSPEQARSFLGIESLSESTAGALSTMLDGVADQIAMTTINEEILVELEAKEAINKIKALKASDFGVSSSYTFRPIINISPIIGDVGGIDIPGLLGGSGFRGGIFGGSAFRGGIFGGNIPGYSNGGMVRGGSQLIEVAEEGSPEMIIPLSSQRRGRALKLWAQAGNIMGVPGFARGGIIGGDGSSDEGIRFRSFGSDGSTAGRSVQVNVNGVQCTLQVNGNDKASIVEAIKAQIGEIADQLVGQIADGLAAEFENTPVRGGA